MRCSRFISGLAVILMVEGIGVSISRGQIQIITPDFLESEWVGPVQCMQSGGIPAIIQSLPPPAVRSAILGGMGDIVMVADPWLKELLDAGLLETLPLETGWLPVVYEGQIIGTEVPWAEGWTAVVPAFSANKSLACEVLSHSCLWQRPVQQLEEYRAFSDRLMEKGFMPMPEDAQVFSIELGGLPIEVTVTPTSIQGDHYFEMIVARDGEGRSFAHARQQPASARNAPIHLKSCTLKPIYDTFLSAHERLANAMDQDPSWCSKAEDCFPPEEIDIDCILDPAGCIFDWIESWLGADALAKLGMSGTDTTVAQYNPAYAVGSRMRAMKLYYAMKNTDGYHYQDQMGSTAIRVKNELTSDSGWSWLHGFDLEGTERLSIIPSGHKWWHSLEEPDGGVTMAPRAEILGQRLSDYAPCGDTAVAHGYGVNLISSGCGDDEDEDPSVFDIIEELPIEWEMHYDTQTGILSVTFRVQGEACYGVYNLCDVCAVGAGESTINTALDGKEVSLEFRLEAYVKAECGVHACMHGEIGGGVGVYMDITYPDACTCKVETYFMIGCGGHGDALNIKRESCDNFRVDGPVQEFDLCNSAAVQNDLSTIPAFTDIYGTPDADSIKKAIEDYQEISDQPYDPWDRWGGIGFGMGGTTIAMPHLQEVMQTVAVDTSKLAQKGEDITVSLDAGWVEQMGMASYVVEYDPTKLTFTGISPGKIGLVDLPMEWALAEPGKLFIWQGTPNPMGVTGSGTLAELHFNAHCSGQAEIRIDDPTFVDANGALLDVEIFRAVVDIRRPAELSDDCSVGLADLEVMATDWMVNTRWDSTIFVEDFESYVDGGISREWDVLTPTTTQIDLSYDNPHAGYAGMRYAYNLSAQPNHCMAERDLKNPYGAHVDSLSLWVRGESGNSEEILFVSLLGKDGRVYVQDNRPLSSIGEEWTPWRIAFTQPQPFHPSRITIGLSSLEGGSGTVYLDDLVVMEPCFAETIADLNRDCRVDLLDLAKLANHWLEGIIVN